MPVKSFGRGKRRLSSTLDSRARQAVAEAVALHTVDTIREAGGSPVVVTDRPTGWGPGVVVVADPGGGLDAAVAAGLAKVSTRLWVVCHADLPLLQPRDVATAVEAAAEGRPVLAPSSDGGTSLVADTRRWGRFRYGPGSFHRHLSTVAHRNPVVLIRLGLLLDLDDPDDLAAVLSHPRGGWLRLALPG
jgi:2-phospho-L-lactate guanylyltransferase